MPPGLLRVELVELVGVGHGQHATPVRWPRASCFVGNTPDRPVPTGGLQATGRQGGSLDRVAGLLQDLAGNFSGVRTGQTLNTPETPVQLGEQLPHPIRTAVKRWGAAHTTLD